MVGLAIIAAFGVVIAAMLVIRAAIIVLDDGLYGLPRAVGHIIVALVSFIALAIIGVNFLV